jgi:GNAT superfamily N-acetyltransferase
MIKLKSLICEDDRSDIEILNSSIKKKYGEYLDQFHVFWDEQFNSIHLSDIYIKPQFLDRGIGTKIMKELTAYADLHRMKMILIPAAADLKPSSAQRLDKFYRQFGFVSDGEYYMDRKPQ